MPTTRHFQLSYKIAAVDQSESAIVAAERVRQNLSSASSASWSAIDGTPGVIVGSLPVQGIGALSDRQDAQEWLERALRDVLSKESAPFDVLISAVAMVDQLGPAIGFQV